MNKLLSKLVQSCIKGKDLKVDYCKNFLFGSPYDRKRMVRVQLSNLTTIGILGQIILCCAPSYAL